MKIASEETKIALLELNMKNISTQVEKLDAKTELIGNKVDTILEKMDSTFVKKDDYERDKNNSHVFRYLIPAIASAVAGVFVFLILAYFQGIHR